jgi:hypothetical protein
MSSYMLLLSESPTLNDNVAPADMQAIFARYMAWWQGLREQDKIVHSNKLQDEGGRTIIRAGEKTVVVDGPYAEAREVISGYFVIKAASYDEALQIAMTCPHVERDGRIDVREVHDLG